MPEGAAIRPLLQALLVFRLPAGTAGGETVLRGKPVFGGAAQLERMRKRRREHGNGLRPGKRHEGVSFGGLWPMVRAAGPAVEAAQVPMSRQLTVDAAYCKPW
ncbi:hypothetical protein GMPD_15450 [Geomonas paludis]|uniref:Uncharacterized protein n=1 Tax=Geomonas paludis TaxID=2740185 RepID=A0A6V8MTY5_9BACT|nr:hypothetical protein GMPD_15450 [Geomonas paludis]